MNFEHEDELLESIDALLEEAKARREEQLAAGIISIPNIKRIQEMENSFRLLKTIAADQKCEVKIDCGQDFLTAGGYITLNCPYGFYTDNMAAFTEAMKAASNVEFVIEQHHIQLGLMYEGIIHETELN